MSVSLICGNLRNLRISVHNGRQHTNSLADELDTYPWYTVIGTAFAPRHASIHFSSRGCSRRDVANAVAHCMERVFGDPGTPVEIRKESRDTV